MLGQTESLLKSIICERFNSVKAFATHIGLSYTTLDSILKRGIEKANVVNIIKICSALSIDTDALIAGRIEERNSTHHTQLSIAEHEHIKKYRTLDEYGKDAVDSILNIEHNRCTKISTLPLAEVIQMPMPIQSTSAGTGEFADDETIEHIPVLRNVWTSKADYALRVHGNSMEPEIYDGDMILVRSQPAVELGETGIFIRDGERYVKIYRGNYLESLNTDYAPIPLEEFSKCIGKVIGVLKPEWIVK